MEWFCTFGKLCLVGLHFFFCRVAVLERALHYEYTKYVVLCRVKVSDGLAWRYIVTFVCHGADLCLLNALYDQLMFFLLANSFTRRAPVLILFLLLWIFQAHLHFVIDCCISEFGMVYIGGGY